MIVPCQEGALPKKKSKKKKKLRKNYCFAIDSQKYNRNIGCKAHDNAYGHRGGGDWRYRRKVDYDLLTHMRAQKDPLAVPVFIMVRLWGWLFFNYHRSSFVRPWRGQLIKKICKCRE